MPEAPPRVHGDLALYGRLLGYVRSYSYCFVLSFAGYLVYSLGTVLLADLMQYLLDALGEEQAASRGFISAVVERFFADSDSSATELARVVAPVAILLLASTRALGFFAGSYFMSVVSRNLVHKLRMQLFDRLLLLPAGYFDAHSQGALVSKLTFNVEQVSGAATKALKTLLRETLVVIGLLSYMFYLNWRLCLVFVAVTPFIVLVVRYVGKRFRRYSRRIQSSMGDVTQVGSESITAWREVRVYGAQQQRQQQFWRASERNRVQSLKLALADALSTPVIQSLLAIALGALVWFALSPQLLSGFTAGSLAAFLTAAVQLGKPVRQLSGVQSVLQRGLAAAEDIFWQIDQRPEPDSGTLDAGRVRGALSLEAVSFTYPGANEAALRDVSLSIPAGSTVALVGRSGSGKSTLVQLLVRFYEPEQGVIALDEVPLQDYSLQALRRQFGIVAQQVPLFRDSVFNNVAFGDSAACSREQVTAALAAAHASDFVNQLPAGLDTVLADGGESLSGGQQQRLAIARALLKDAPVLVLDEATSALDAESEGHIQAALETITRDRTTIVIAHRLSTVERADLIAVLDGGRIVATGTHEELLAQDGLYRQLYQQDFNA